MLTTVVFLMVVSTKLLTIVNATYKVSTTTSVSIIKTSITWSVTVSLSFPTRILWSTAPSSIIVTASAALPCRRLNRNPWYYDRSWSLIRNRRWKITTVILLMEIETELLAVIAPTHKVSFAASMSIINPSIKRSIP